MKRRQEESFSLHSLNSLSSTSASSLSPLTPSPILLISTGKEIGSACQPSPLPLPEIPFKSPTSLCSTPLSNISPDSESPRRSFLFLNDNASETKRYIRGKMDSIHTQLTDLGLDALSPLSTLDDANNCSQAQRGEQLSPEKTHFGHKKRLRWAASSSSISSKKTFEETETTQKRKSENFKSPELKEMGNYAGCKEQQYTRE